MQGDGSLSTRDLSLSGVKAIDQIADAVKQPSLKDMKVKDMTLDFTIKDGRVETDIGELESGFHFRLLYVGGGVVAVHHYITTHGVHGKVFHIHFAIFYHKLTKN